MGLQVAGESGRVVGQDGVDPDAQRLMPVLLLVEGPGDEEVPLSRLVDRQLYFTCSLR